MYSVLVCFGGCSDVATATGSPDSKQADQQQVSEAGFQPVANQRPRFVNTMRVWWDAEQTYSTHAELLAFSNNPRQVKLLKENGVMITVPFNRLSKHDQLFVQEYLRSVE